MAECMHLESEAEDLMYNSKNPQSLLVFTNLMFPLYLLMWSQQDLSDWILLVLNYLLVNQGLSCSLKCYVCCVGKAALFKFGSWMILLAQHNGWHLNSWQFMDIIWHVLPSVAVSLVEGNNCMDKWDHACAYVSVVQSCALLKKLLLGIDSLPWDLPKWITLFLLYIHASL